MEDCHSYPQSRVISQQKQDNVLVMLVSIIILVYYVIKIHAAVFITKSLGLFPSGFHTEARVSFLKAISDIEYMRNFLSG